MNVEIGTETRYSFSGNICFDIPVFCLCSAEITTELRNFTQHNTLSAVLIIKLFALGMHIVLTRVVTCPHSKYLLCFMSILVNGFYIFYTKKCGNKVYVKENKPKTLSQFFKYRQVITCL